MEKGEHGIRNAGEVMVQKGCEREQYWHGGVVAVLESLKKIPEKFGLDFLESPGAQQSNRLDRQRHHGQPQARA
jgi:hypothetical protein